MMMELATNALHSSAQGFFGVTLIGVYFAVILATAVYRIRKGEHLH